MEFTEIFKGLLCDKKAFKKPFLRQEPIIVEWGNSIERYFPEDRDLMRSCLHLLLWIGLLLTTAACAPAITRTPTLVPSPSPAGSALRGVFEGITPCSAQTRPLPQIPADTDCELMIWKIVLHEDSATGTPTAYTLTSAYGVSQANTTNPAGGGTPIVMEGNWGIVKGTKTDPGAEVYQLYSNDSQVAASFIKMSADLLHVLNKDLSLMVGNGAWSYTLNRTDNQTPYVAQPVSEPPLPTRPPIPRTPPGSSVLGAFEGRFPCHEMVFEILKITPYPGCLKIKSRLTLYQDQTTGAPSSYMYMGTSTIREGTWTIIQGMEGDPDAVIYQIQLDGSQKPVSFLKVDENHLFLLDRDRNLLVGNALFSYTLSRVEKNTP